MSQENGVPEHGLEEIQKKLYQRDAGDFKVRRSELNPAYHAVNRDWTGEGNTPPVKTTSWWTKILWGSFVFFLVAVGVAYYIFTSDSNVVSDKNINVTVQGPVQVKAGDELNLQIGITNKNSTAIDQVELTAAWPAGTKNSASGTPELKYQTLKVGVIAAGETVNLAVKAVIFGKENDELEVKLSLRYHLAGSNTLFEKEALYRLKVTASPIDLSVTAPPEINSNQELILEIHATANSDKPVSDVVVEVIYPAGFELKNASLPPTADGNKWRLGDLAPGTERIIRLTGVIEGQAEQLRAFEVRAGTGSTGDQSIAILYNDIFKTVTIKKPFLGLALLDETSGANAQFTQTGNQPKRYIVRWTNNLPVTASDIVITGKISGDALDKSSVSVERGFYSSADNLITWDKHTFPALAVADPGTEGDLTIRFGSLPLSGTLPLRNPRLDLALNISGQRVSEGFSGERVETDLNRTIKIDSDVLVSARSLYHDGPFKNTGPIPPRAEQTTTYTINWSVANSSNDVNRATVKTILPLGVSWVGLVSPAGEKVSYDEAARRVSWDIGLLKQGTGFGATARRAASFQLSIVPSVSQLGGPATLIRSGIFHGLDTWSGTELTQSPADLSTDISSDSGYRDGDGVVKN